jgi:hypothetical protein
MKKKLVLLGMLLMTSLSSFSQTRSKITKDDCVVPCIALRNALVMNEDYQALKLTHGLVKDSLGVLIQMNEKKDELIGNKDKQILLYQDNEKKYEGIIVEKDKQISEWKRKYKKEKTLRHLGFGSTLLVIAGAAILLL